MGNNILVLKMTGEQKDPVTEEGKKTVATNRANFDASSAQTALLTSAKVENNVQQVFFNQILSNRNN